MSPDEMRFWGLAYVAVSVTLTVVGLLALDYINMKRNERKQIKRRLNSISSTRRQ